jgi:hypothetical protein
MRRFALLLLAAPLALAACGSSHRAISSGPHKIDLVAYVKRAATKTADLTSEHIVTSGSMSAAGAKISFDGSGDFANKPERGSFAASFSAPAPVGTATLDEVIEGGSLYASSSFPFTRLPIGKTWVRYDLGKVGKTIGIDFSGVTSRTPEQALKELEAAGMVTKRGTETIGGVATTHFRVENLNVSKLPEGGKLGALGVVTYGPIDVWIANGNGLIYRETLPFSFTVRGRRVSATTTENFSKFGESIHVTVPRPGQTIDYSELKGVETGLGG